jgi:hypothetical protein
MMSVFLDRTTSIILTAVCAMLCLTLSVRPASAVEKTNILLIVVDEQLSEGPAS